MTQDAPVPDRSGDGFERLVMDGDGGLVPGAPGGAAGYPAPPAWQAPPSPWRVGRADLTGAALVTVVLAAFGLLLGVLWYLVAPRIGFRIDDSGIPVRADLSGSEEFVAADGWFVILGAVTGVVAGILAWAVLRRRRGPLIAVALAVGGLLGALLTWWLGHQLAPAPSAAEIREAGRLLHTSLQVHSKAALIFEPFAAVAAYVVLTGFAGDDDLRGDSRAGDAATQGGVGEPAAAPGWYAS